jgi:hypothetical protein
VACSTRRYIDRAVRARGAEDLGGGVGVGVEVDEADGSVDGGDGADVGLAIEWSPPSTTGIAPAATTSATVRSIAAWLPGESPGSTGASP